MRKLRQEEFRSFVLFPVLHILLRAIPSWSQYDARRKGTPHIGSERVPRQGLRGCIEATIVLFKGTTPERRDQILLQRMRDGSLPNVRHFESRRS